ncbi:MAG TPA: hypothetical protein VMD05_04485 [Candidatus Nanoarchaeia archaeon]|nr:hypothetical protein [Candidatus Nanoarchaeia archaeon]
MNGTINKEILKEKEITHLFQEIEEEIALIAASARFEFNLRKTTEKELELKLAYVEDTLNLMKILKTRMNLLWKTTS